MSENWKAWLINALNALLSGAFAAGGSLVAGITFKQGLIVVGTAMIGSFAKWYAQHPLPGADK